MNSTTTTTPALLQPAAFTACAALAALACLIGCSKAPDAPGPAVGGAMGPDPLQLVLVPHQGDSRLDQRIRQRQAEVKKARNKAPHLERLGALWVVKARASFDPGYYKLAEQCAACIERRQPDSPAALLLRGHVLHSLHEFAEAESVARKLVRKRGGFLDHGLLGDVLLDQGKLKEALHSYQAMLDKKPCLQSYVRAARIRWLRGDLASARRLLSLATGAGSPRAPESLAWTYTRLAMVDFQCGNDKAARQSCEAALKILPDYAPALLQKGRLLLAQGDSIRALGCIRRAAELNPLPEYRWLLVDALATAGRQSEAAVVDIALCRTGAQDDPRTFALYLLSFGRTPRKALELAQGELGRRQDVYTHDVHAWALLANGHKREAAAAIERALAQGTQDARLFYHAGAIAAANGDKQRARGFFAKADELHRMLLPSEQRDLARRKAAL